MGGEGQETDGTAARVGGQGGRRERWVGERPAGAVRLDRGDPTDLQVLRAISEGGDRPQFAADLAERIGIASERVPVRLATLVSLGYVAVLVAGKGPDDGYTLTELGAAELLRRDAEDRRAR